MESDAENEVTVGCRVARAMLYQTQHGFVDQSPETKTPPDGGVIRQPAGRTQKRIVAENMNAYASSSTRSASKRILASSFRS